MTKLFTIQYEINDACNLRCSHCYHGRKVIKEGAVAIERLFQDLDDLHQVIGEDYNFVIRLSGGEVFLRKDLMDLLLKILNKGYVTVLLTNGTLLTRENALKLMMRFVGLTQISLDGPNADIHDAIRGKGQFEKALEGVRHLKSTAVPVSLSYTLMAHHNDSYEHFIEMLRVAQQEGADVVNFSRIFPQGDAHNVPEHAYNDGHHFKRVLESLLDAAREFPEQEVVIKDPLVKNLEAPIPDNVFVDVCCYIKENYLSVTANGDVFACRKLGKPLGNLLDDTLANIWQNNELLQQMADRRIYMKGKCQSCPIRYECRGGCLAASYGLTGELFVPDPACWREEVPV